MSETIDRQLFIGPKIYLDGYDFERDVEAEARWTRDPEYLHLVDFHPAFPRTAQQIKRQRQDQEKEDKTLHLYAARTLEEGRLVGVLSLGWIEWSNGNAFLKLAIGEPQDRGHGYGGEALDLILHIAFDELNLFRITTFLPEYNLLGQEMLSKFGFSIEARRRQALRLHNRWWDALILGLLREDWQKCQAVKEDLR